MNHKEFNAPDEKKSVAIWTLTCSDCALENPFQPCEACPNRRAQNLDSDVLWKRRHR